MSKTVLVTGGGRGLGRGVAIALGKAGHEVLLTARSLDAGKAVVDEVKRQAPSARVEARVLDLSSFASIRAFGAALPEGQRFDTVFHVAGIMQQSAARRLSADGFEETLAVNTLAPFLLTHELLPRIGGGPTPGRVVCVSSRLHLPDSRGVPVNFDFDDPNLERSYHPERAYKNSKLAVLWFAYELARRVSKERLTVHGVCPGFVPETGAASTTGMLRFMMRFVLPHLPFATSAHVAVENLCFTAVDPLLDASTGDFWTERRASPSSPQSRDEQDARRFWDWACDMTKTGPWP
ncbi:MAG: SDR family NAD(P)-dependent oxidoreductase [Myxococcaceae bacterium]|nr:SDR family NAD(P)-dependent oxidoreductase [Myxococcaceae bacterium]